MAKKKSLFKKLRKNESSLVAEPEAPVDDLILEAISQPKVVEVVRPVIVRKPYIAPAKTYPAKIDVEVNKNDIFGALSIASKRLLKMQVKVSMSVSFIQLIQMKKELLHIYFMQNFLVIQVGCGR